MNTAIGATPAIHTGLAGTLRRLVAAVAARRERRRAAQPSAAELHALRLEAARLRDDARTSARFSHVH
ncbi:hypothetical protein [Agromyces bracchium]|uniref:Uncharacterized protein n=1 Tax=Agromyces bracchium TaxID=88376 RepID=A0A6I3M2R0_9MICO|nr:hypothetical protein [Agromyces bracchium]MTH67624.1 hypothetical protein [Agromyces bracchium]